MINMRDDTKVSDVHDYQCLLEDHPVKPGDDDRTRDEDTTPDNNIY